MNVNTEKDCAGKALYLEFRNGIETYQMVMMPHTISLDGLRSQPAMLLSRKTNSWVRRKNWGFSSGRGLVELQRDAVSGYAQMGLDEAQREAAHMFRQLVDSTLNTLFHNGWTLYRSPLVVEFSYKDLENVRARKTPNDLLRRIQRSREAAGWGESIHNTVAPTPPVVLTYAPTPTASV
jgi:hypothetical protein